jgi:hypothetical protein
LSLAIALLGAIALFGGTNPQAANARLQCRSDPLVVLSDGTVLDISADIGAHVWDVKRVQYTLYIPAGLKVVKQVSTPNWPTTTERFTIYATNPVGKFRTDTLVRTREPNVPVVANFLLNLTFKSKHGLSGQTLVLTLRR